MARPNGDTRRSRDHHGRWLELLLDVALIANEAESVDRALRSAMRRVCEHNGWYAGFSHIDGRSDGIWWLAPDGGTHPGVDAESRELARRWALQVMEAGRIQHVVDFAAGAAIDFELPGCAPTSGGAIAAPLVVGERSVGAMVFYSQHPLTRELDADRFTGLLRVVEGIGTLLGRVIERWLLVRRIAEEVEREQEAVGREIHDGLAQQIVGVKLLVQNLRRQMRDAAEPYARQWDLLLEHLTRAQAQARAMARGLSAGVILTDSESLIQQLEELASVVETGHEVECAVEVDGSFSIDETLTRTQLYRIVREAVFNALRHADPGRIVIALAADDDRAVVEVRDDGGGLPAGEGSSEGMGISGMRYRAGLIGARLELDSEPGAGTVVRCILREGEAA